jgi:hypothetical protein
MGHGSLLVSIRTTSELMAGSGSNCTNKKRPQQRSRELLATAVRVGFTLCRVLAHKVGLLSNRNHFNPPLAVADFAASRKYSQPRLRRLFHGLEAGATTRFACLHWNLGKPLSHFEILTAALSGLIYRPRMCVTGFLTRNNAGNFAGQWKTNV